MAHLQFFQKISSPPTRTLVLSLHFFVRNPSFMAIGECRNKNLFKDRKLGMLYNTRSMTIDRKVHALVHLFYRFKYRVYVVLDNITRKCGFKNLELLHLL